MSNNKPKQRTPKKPTTLQQGWISFARQVIPPDAHVVQRMEMRKAYYAAAAIVMDMMLQLSEKPEEHAVAGLESLHKELEDFTQQLLLETNRNN